MSTPPDAASAEPGAEPDPNRAQYHDLIRQVCATLDLPDAEAVIRSRRVEIQGFDVYLLHFDSDARALYIQFDYGVPTAGRTLVIFRLMLESNILVYAQDQAQLGLDPDTGSTQLIVRVPMTDEIDGAWLMETLAHYAEHGRYWREHLMRSPDDAFEAISAGQYLWLRA